MNHIGLCLAYDGAEQATPILDVDASRRLYLRFMKLAAGRARLAGADGTELQAIIDAVGRRVRGRILRC